MVQVRFKAEIVDQGGAELLKIMGAKIVGSMAFAAYHVVVVSVGVFELVVEPVANGYLGQDTQVLEQMKSSVNGGDVHVGVSFLGTTKDLVYAQVVTALRHDGQDQQSLGGEPVPLLPKSLNCFFVSRHASTC
jgi:hypothetical protein